MSGTKQPCEQPHHQPSGNTSDAVNKRWQCYVDQVLMPVTESPAPKCDAKGLAVFFYEDKVAGILKFTEDGEELLETQSTNFPINDLRKEVFISVEWLYEFKHLFLSLIKPYETLIICHFILLILLFYALIVVMT